MLEVLNYKNPPQPSDQICTYLHLYVRFCILLEAQNKKLQCRQELFHSTQIYPRKNDNIFTCEILYNTKLTNGLEKSLFLTLCEKTRLLPTENLKDNVSL